ncbi:MAG: rhomboid family intramembrane serine protease [Spirochaetaceae bacterium]|jgi:membrane associated rhomboid family serine protease|nr:rhomboid family intramembrane serine protease [Spirochaetaceae bacterium]
MSVIRKPFRYRNNNVVFFLIGINILVFILQQISPYIGYYAALNPIGVLQGRVWQFVTYMFAHGGFNHLLFNMLALFIFGVQVERHIGSVEFLLYYMLTGVLAGVFSFGVYFLTGAYEIFLLGASGAIFAVQLAYAAFFPDSVIYVWGILPLRAPIMVLGFTAIELVSSIIGVRNGVAHLTHLAGFGFGWLYFLIRFGKNPWRFMLGR